MNDFTKEELIKLKNGLEYLPDIVNLSKQYFDECETIIKKLNIMIDNYCEHEWIEYPNDKLTVQIIVNYKGMHSALEIDLSHFKNEDHYLQVIKDHVNIAKIVIDKKMSSIK